MVRVQILQRVGGSYLFAGGGAGGHRMRYVMAKRSIQDPEVSSSGSADGLSDACETSTPPPTEAGFKEAGKKNDVASVAMGENEVKRTALHIRQRENMAT